MRYYATFLLLVLVREVGALPPSWEVNPADFELSANMTMVVYVNGELLVGENNRVGAFVGGELRGAVAPIQVGENWLYFLTTYANEADEDVSFKVYVAARDEVVEIATRVEFVAGETYGDPVDPFAIFAQVEEGRGPSQLITVVMDTVVEPSEFALGVAYPNPFNAATHIGYWLPVDGLVELSIYDVLGRLMRRVVAEEQTAGEQVAIWDGRDDRGRAVATGAYFYVLRVGRQILGGKLSLLR